MPRNYHDDDSYVETAVVEYHGTKAVKKHWSNTNCLRMEYDIGMTLNTLNLPNFVRMLAWNEDEPALIEQYVGDVSFETFALTQLQDLPSYYRLVMQIYLALLVAQEQLGFCHGDLHLGNIHVIPTNVEYLEYTYQKELYRVETHGYLAVIIDFDQSRLGVDKNDDLWHLLDFCSRDLLAQYTARNSEKGFLDILCTLI